MPNAVITNSVFSNVANSAIGRQNFLSAIETAFVGNAGMSAVDTYVQDASTDAKVFSMPLNPSGLIFLRILCTSSSNDYTLTFAMFESWNVGNHTGSGQSLSQNISFGNVIINPPLTMEAVNHPEIRGVNFYSVGLFRGRIFILSPLNRPTNFITPHCFIAGANDSDLIIYYSSTNPVNSPVNRAIARAVFQSGSPSSTLNSGSNRPWYFPGFLAWWDTIGGQFIGSTSTDLASCSNSSAIPLGSESDPPGYQNIWASISIGVMIKVA